MALTSNLTFWPYSNIFKAFKSTLFWFYNHSGYDGYEAFNKIPLNLIKSGPTNLVIIT